MPASLKLSVKPALLAACILAAAPLLLSTTASAEEAALAPAAVKALIKERHHGFEAMGKSMKAINKELKSSKADSATIAKAADELLLQAEKIAGWFPAGSGPEAGFKTDALPYIWKNPQKFKQIGDALVVDAKGLVSVAGSGDTAAIKKQFVAVKDQCSACHDSFRED